MEKGIIVLLALAACCASLLAEPVICRAEEVLQVGGYGMEAASTDCTDGTQLFVVRKRLSFPGIYLFKDGSLVFSNEGLTEDHETSGLGVAKSIACTRHGIVIHGESAAYSVTVALVNENGALALKLAGGGRGQCQVVGNESSTSVLSYGDDRQGREDEVDHEVELPGVFTVPENAAKIPLSVRPCYTPSPGTEADLTAFASCYNKALGDDYSVAAYTKDGTAGLLDIFDTAVPKSTHSLSFIAGNAVCVEGDTYVWANTGEKRQAVRISYDAKAKRFMLRVMPMNDAPFWAYLLHAKR